MTATPLSMTATPLSMTAAGLSATAAFVSFFIKVAKRALLVVSG